MTVEEARAWLDFLRTQGLSAFSVDGMFSASFMPERPSAAVNTPADTKASVDALEELMAMPGCPCGHPDHAHMGGLCLSGCDVSICAGPEDSPPAVEVD